MQEKKGRVIYLPMVYFPSYTELEHLQKLQEYYSTCAAQIEFECYGDRYAEVLRKEMLANRLRSKFYVINDLKGDEP